MSNESEFWKEDPALSEVMDRIQGYESWVEKDPSVLSSMDDSILKVMNTVEIHLPKISKMENQAELEPIVQSALVILGFLPVKRALYYLTEFQKYQPFFEAMAVQLNKTPPLQDYAKTLLARASVVQQRQLHMAVNSDENFALLTQCLERIFEKG